MPRFSESQLIREGRNLLVTGATGTGRICLVITENSLNYSENILDLSTERRIFFAFTASFVPDERKELFLLWEGLQLTLQCKIHVQWGLLYFFYRIDTLKPSMVRRALLSFLIPTNCKKK